MADLTTDEKRKRAEAAADRLLSLEPPPPALTPSEAMAYQQQEQKERRIESPEQYDQLQSDLTREIANEKLSSGDYRPKPGETALDAADREARDEANRMMRQTAPKQGVPTGLLDAFARTLTPSTLEQRAPGYAARLAGEAAAMTSEAVGLTEFVATSTPSFVGLAARAGMPVAQAASDALNKEVLRQYGDQGVPAQSFLANAIETIGTITPAIIQEAAYATPMPVAVSPEGDVAVGVHAAFAPTYASGRNFLNSLRYLTGEDENLGGQWTVQFRRAEEGLLGTTPELRGLYTDAALEGKAPLAKFFYNAMLKTEQGAGLSDDFEASYDVNVPQSFQEQHPNVNKVLRSAASGTGFLLDLAVPWEGVYAPIAKAAKAGRVTRMMPDVSAGAKGEIFRRAFLDDYDGIADLVAHELRAQVTSGTPIDEILASLPVEIRDQVLERLGVRREPVATPPTRPTVGVGADSPGATTAPIDAPPLPRRDVAQTDYFPESPRRSEDATTRALPPEDAPTGYMPRGTRAPDDAPTEYMPGRRTRPEDAPTKYTPGQRTSREGARTNLMAREDAPTGYVPGGTRRPDDAPTEYMPGRRVRPEDAPTEYTVNPRKAIRRDVQKTLDDAAKALDDAKADIKFGKYNSVQEAIDEMSVGVNTPAQWREVSDQLAIMFHTDQPMSRRPDLGLFNKKAHGGGEFLKNKRYPKLEVNQPRYMLLDSEGRTRVKGTLQRVLQQFKARANAADRIVMDIDERPVASWRTKEATRRNAPAIAADPNLSTLDEAALVKLESEGVTRPPKVAVVTNNIGLPEPDFANVSAFLRGMLGGTMQPGLRRSLTPREATAIKFIQDAYKARYRQAYGTDKLVQIAPNVFVPVAEKKRIAKTIKATQKRAGLDLSKFRVKLGRDGYTRVLDIPDDQANAYAKYMAMMRMPVPFGEMPEALWLKMHARKAAEMAGEVAHARQARRAIGDNTDDMMQGVWNLLGTRPGMALFAAQTLNKMRRTVNLFSKDVEYKGLAPVVKDRVKDIERELAGVGQVVLSDVRRAQTALPNDASMQDILDTVLPEYTPVTWDELMLLNRLEAGPPLNRGTQRARNARMLAMRHVIASASPDAIARHPRLASSDPAMIQLGIDDWQKATLKNAAEYGRAALQAQLNVDVGPGQRLTGKAAERLENKQRALRENVDDATAKLAWLNHIESGFDSAENQKIIANAAGKEGLSFHDSERASLNLLLQLKRAEMERKAAAEIVDLGLGVSHRHPELRAMVEQLLLEPDGRQVNLASDKQRALAVQARNILNRLGVTEAVEGARLNAFGDQYLAPGMAARLRRAARAGTEIGTDVERAVVVANRAYKDGLTLPAAAYHMSNVVSVPFIMLSQLGLGGTLRAFKAVNDNLGVVTSLSNRVSDLPYLKTKGLDTRMVQTDDGQVFSVEYLTDHAKQTGALETLQQSRTERELADDVVQMFKPGGSLRGAYNVTIETLRNVSEFIERLFRAGVYVDVLKRTGSPDNAARASKEALFDYQDLSQADKFMGRWLSLFWSYQRKNLDSFMYQSMKNPVRIGRQMRFARDQRDLWGDSEVQQAIRSDADLGRVVLAKMDPQRDDVSPIDTVEVATGSAINFVDALALLQNVYQFAKGALGRDFEATTEAAREVLSLNPYLEYLVNLVSNQDVRTAKELQDESLYVVPEWLMSLMGDTLIAHDVVEFQSLAPYQAFEQADDWHSAMPGHWVVKPESRQQWSMLRSLPYMQRPLDETMQDAYDAMYGVTRAVAGEDLTARGRRVVKPWQTNAMAILKSLGFTVRPTATEAEAESRLYTTQSLPAQRALREARQEQK